MELQELKKIIDLETILVEHGYNKNKDKSTRSIPVYDNGNEYLIVRQGNDCKTYYVSHSEEKGTVIDFLKNRPELLQNYPARNIYESIKKCLSHHANINERLNITATPTPLHQDSEFSRNAFFIPRSKNIEHRCFSYLKQRGITQESLNSEVFNNIGLVEQTIKENKYYNLAFPLFDKNEDVKAIDYRFLGKDEKHHKMFTTGSDKKHTIGISSDKREGIKELILTESPIDAMSHYQLYRKGRGDIQYLYFDGTLTKEQIALFLEYKKKIGNPQITLGFDNDPDGKLIGQAYTTSMLCSMLSNIPVTFSYAAKNQFAFIFDKNISENSVLFKKILKSNEIDFNEREQTFSFLFVKTKDIINKINKILLSALPLTYIETSLTNDWNDDLKIKNGRDKNTNIQITKSIGI